jgi:hypothetical protein
MPPRQIMGASHQVSAVRLDKRWGAKGGAREERALSHPKSDQVDRGVISSGSTDSRPVAPRPTYRTPEGWALGKLIENRHRPATDKNLQVVTYRRRGSYENGSRAQ